MTVRETIDGYFDALTAGDADRLLSLISERSFRKIGTEAGELVTDPRDARVYYEHHVASTADFTIDTVRLDIQEHGDVVWFLTEQTWRLKWQGNPETLSMRITGVLAREDGAWRFTQIHASTGVA